jgi:hypothetical protein
MRTYSNFPSNYAQKEQIEEFIRHKQEALGCKRLKAISAAKDSFVLKHTTAVNCQVSVSLSENNILGRRPMLRFG